MGKFIDQILDHLRSKFISYTICLVLFKKEKKKEKFVINFMFFKICCFAVMYKE